jgi:hypothetical protein
MAGSVASANVSVCGADHLVGHGGSRRIQNKGIEIPLLIFLLTVPSQTIWKRLNLNKPDGTPFRLGHRANSLIALLVLVLIISILAIEKVLPTDALVTLLGTIVGYSLSSLSKEG